MKNFLLLLILLLATFAQTSYGQGDAPPFTQGLSQAAKSVSSVIKVPSNQITKLSSSQVLLETGNKNLLVNASFENLITPNSGWTTSLTGTASTAEAQVTTRVDGNKGYQFTCNGMASGGTCTFRQDVATTQAIQGVASMYVGTDTPTYGTINPVKLLARKNAVNQTGGVAVVTTSLKPYKVPVILDTTSTGVAVEVTVAAGQTIITNFDDAKVGAEDVKVDGAKVGPWTSWTPTGGWTGASVTYTGRYRQVGESAEFEVNVALTGAPTGTNLYINLPLTIDSSKMPNLSTEKVIGYGTYTDTGTIQYQGFVAYQTTTQVLALTSGTAGTFLSAASTVNNTQPHTFGSTDTVNLRFSVPVVEFAGAISTYSQPYYAIDRIGEVIYSTNPTAPSGFISALGTSIGETTSAATLKGVSYKPLYEHLWNVAGLSTTAGYPYVISSAKGVSAAADWAANKTITIDYATNGLFLRAKKSAATLGSYTDDTFQGHLHGPSSGANFYWEYNGGAGTRITTGAGTEGNGYTNTGTPVTDGVNGTPRTATETAPDHTSLYLYVRYQADNQVAVLNLSGLEACADSYTCTNTFTAYVGSTGVKQLENIPWISSIGLTDTSLFTITFASGLAGGGSNLTQAVTCEVTPDDTTTTVKIGAQLAGTTSTTAAVRTGYSNTGSSFVKVAYGFHISCTKAGADFHATTAKAVASDANVRSIGSVGVDIQSVYFGSGTDCNAACTTGNCTICSQVGSKITSVAWNATGGYVLNGINGKKYICTVSARGVAATMTGEQEMQYSNTTSTYIQFWNTSGAGANAQGASAICVGIP